MQNCSSVSTHFKVLLIILLWPHFGGSSSSLDIDLTKKSKKKKKKKCWMEFSTFLNAK